jgi:hypothetical protein
MHKGLKVNTIYAFIAEDADGTEGIIGQLMPDNSWLPFIAADEERLSQLKLFAQKISNVTKKEIKLIKLSKREDVELLIPQSLQ